MNKKLATATFAVHADVLSQVSSGELVRMRYEANPAACSSCHHYSICSVRKFKFNRKFISKCNMVAVAM